MTTAIGGASMQAASSIEEQVVILRVHHSDYAVPIGRVQEIVRVPEITPLPEAPPEVEGIINLRGRVLPVIDLPTRLGLGVTERTRGARVVVVKAGVTESFDVGLLVDGVSKVIRVAASDFESAKSFGTAASSAVEGVAKMAERLVLLLDLDVALSAYQHLAQLESFQNENEPAERESVAAGI